MSENGEIYTAGKNFTLPPAVTAGTNLTSESMHSPMKRRHYLKFAGSFCSPRHGRQTQLLIRSLKSHGNYLDFHEFLLLWILSDCDISSHLTLNFQEKYIFCINKIFSGTGQGTKTDEFSEKFQTAFDPNTPPLKTILFSGNHVYVFHNILPSYLLAYIQPYMVSSIFKGMKACIKDLQHNFPQMRGGG